MQVTAHGDRQRGSPAVIEIAGDVTCHSATLQAIPDHTLVGKVFCVIPLTGRHWRPTVVAKTATRHRERMATMYAQEVRPAGLTGNAPEGGRDVLVLGAGFSRSVSDHLPLVDEL